MLDQVVERVEARLRATNQSASAASAKAGLSKDAIRNMQRAAKNGDRQGVSTATITALAPVLETSVGWLLEGAGEAARRGIPVVGYVGAASEFYGFDDHEPGAGLDEIEAPPGVPEGAVAVIVRGDSGYPAIRDGMVLVYWSPQEEPAGDIIGQDCFVRLKDGRTLVKILERGSGPGLWTLISMNATTPPIRDVEIDWAAPIEIRLRRKNWKA